MKKNEEATKIVALGGLGEVGKNMYVITYKNELFIVDAGVMFPESDLLGIDYVIQDITFLKQNENKIKGLLITHGHEDHIGGISFLLQQINVPVIYAPKIAVDLINNKLVDRGVKYSNIETIERDTVIKSKHFTIEFVGTTHSIPDSFGIVFHTPHGTVVTTGDFKFDLNPIGPMADIHKMARIGESGVRLLLSDSTNALSAGFSKSESSVDDALSDIISTHNGRLIIATFASNIYRIKHIVETCKENNRKIVVFGRSMDTSINLALNNGLITDKSMFVDANAAKNLKKTEVCILCTGSQGEPLAALSRIANGTHRQISLMSDDLVIFSSSPIPGNASSINRIINKLYLKGVKVFTNSEFSDIHTSGHAKEEELKLMIRFMKPEFFMPMHGEHRMLQAHADIAISCGVKPENNFVLTNGDVIEMTSSGIQKTGTVTAGDVYVDGSRIGDVGSLIIKDRKLMSKDGILVTIININPASKRLLIKPNVTTRGFVLVNENTELIHQIERKITDIIHKYLETSNYSYTNLRNQIILELAPYINNLTGRKPIVLPVIMEVNEPKEM